ncbi:MAG: FMN-binding negative transcriptional regulator [Candidatus Eremiobacteraeota bacterium]|nr:FMN-binding negative transcriptional regulator [Candidatus Eremiobacteraeota bacterium]
MPPLHGRAWDGRGIGQTLGMYVPTHNRERNLDVLQRAIDEVRFGTLVTVGADGPIATHIPMFIDKATGSNGTVFGHIARANPQWQKTDPTIRALATFVGPYAYITPSFYETKRITGKVVPTWHYLAVQARGPIAFFDDPKRLHDIVYRSTTIMESAATHPWAVDDAPEDYVRAMLSAIVGFEIRIETLEGAWKFAQNKDAADLQGVTSGLEQRGDREVAALVRERGGRDGRPDPGAT